MDRPGAATVGLLSMLSMLLSRLKMPPPGVLCSAYCDESIEQFDDPFCDSQTALNFLDFIYTVVDGLYLREIMMKRYQKAVAIAWCLSLPMASFAASDGVSPTRAEVRAELILAEQTGQYPRSREHYPDVAPNVATTYVANKAVAGGAFGSSGFDSVASSSGSIRHRTASNIRPSSDSIYKGH
jgi:hypothetical protein